MTNTCTDIDSRLAALEAAIGNLKPIDPAQIISEAVQQAVAKIPGIATPIAAGLVLPVAYKATTALSTAQQAESAAQSALSTAGSALAKAGQAIAEIAGLVAQVAAFGVALGTLLVLGGRIDALESEVDSLSGGVSQALGAAQGAKSIAINALGVGEGAEKDAISALEAANSANGTANGATAKANKALETATSAQGTAQSALTTAQQALAQKAIPGPQGKQGPQGATGAPGVQGKPGVDGKNGVDGKDGAPGAQGLQGAPGPQGAPGAQGLQGAPGPQGAPGKNGINAALTPTQQAALASIAKLTTQVNAAQNTALQALALSESQLSSNPYLRQLQLLQSNVGSLANQTNQNTQQVQQQVKQLQNNSNQYITVPAAIQLIDIATQPIDSTLTSVTSQLQSLQNQTNQPKITLLTASDITQINELINSALAPLDAQQNNQQNIINQLNNQIQQQKQMDTLGNAKLDNLTNLLTPAIPAIFGIPAVIGRAANQVIEAVPDVSDITTAAGNAICKSANGGCMSKALGNTAQNINNNTNQGQGNLLNKLNTLGQGLDLSLLGVINNKLGDAIPGGIGGKLVQGFKWLQLDRALNMLTFIATIQNHLMLSNSIKDTLVGALTNVFQLLGFKDDSGNPVDVGTIINNTVENFIISIVGAQNYQSLSLTFAKANRIYQASANVFNSFTNLSNQIIQISELAAGYTGKIGNALKRSGVILQDCYQWMNPQPKANRITEFLDGLGNTANTIQQVTQTPLDVIQSVAQLQEANRAFLTAVGNDNVSGNQAPTPPQAQAELQMAASEASASQAPKITDLDLQSDN